MSQVEEFILISTEAQYYRQGHMTGKGAPGLAAAAAAGDDFLIDYVRVFDVAVNKTGTPCLQAPGETSMGVSWAVSGLAKGVVEIADNPQFENAWIAKGTGSGIVPIEAVIWNGDAAGSSTQSKREAVEAILDQPVEDADWAADIPSFFVCGNHDVRGSWPSRLGEVMLPRDPSERRGDQWDLAWNFAARLGDLALVGLDTGEDKPDAHPKWFGLAAFEPYRRKQAEWLAEALARPDIASAPFKVVFCHIPLFAAPDHRDYPTAPGRKLSAGVPNWA